MSRDAESEDLLLWLKDLDESEHDVSSWEADFIENVLYGDYDGPLSEKQRDVIYRMQEKYDV
jgi:hypothetical protein